MREYSRTTLSDPKAKSPTEPLILSSGPIFDKIPGASLLNLQPLKEDDVEYEDDCPLVWKIKGKEIVVPTPKVVKAYATCESGKKLLGDAMDVNKERKLRNRKQDRVQCLRMKKFLQRNW